MDRRRTARRWPWLAAALLLLLGGAWLMSRGERMPSSKEVQVRLPRAMSAADYQRLRQRQRPPILAAQPEEAEPLPDTPASAPRDRLLLALPPRVEKVAIVVEANALRHSPIGELMLDCFVGPQESDRLGKLHSQTGLDVLEDLDRVAVADHSVFVSGRFEEARWAELFPGMRDQASDSSTRRWKSEGGGRSVLLWRNQIMVIGRTDDEVQAAVDRLEGRAPVAEPVIAENETYGEIYGVVASAALAALLEQQSPEVAAQVRAITDKVKLHVDASHDVGIVADAKGNDPTGAADLAKTLGGALALGRAAARAQGNDDLAAFLDHASVRPAQSGAFRVELALPLEYLRTQLKDCPGRKARESPAGGG